MEITGIGICSICKRRVNLYYFHPDDHYYAHTHFGCKGEICEGSHQLPAAYIETAGEGISLHREDGPERPITLT